MLCKRSCPLQCSCYLRSSCGGRRDCGRSETRNRPSHKSSTLISSAILTLRNRLPLHNNPLRTAHIHRLSRCLGNQRKKSIRQHLKDLLRSFCSKSGLISPGIHPLRTCHRIPTLRRPERIYLARNLSTHWTQLLGERKSLQSTFRIQ